jgi:hypothetical protein
MEANPPYIALIVAVQGHLSIRALNMRKLAAASRNDPCPIFRPSQTTPPRFEFQPKAKRHDFAP